MNSSMNALLVGEMVKAVLVRAALAQSHFSLNVDYIPLKNGEFNVLFIRHLQFASSPSPQLNEITRRVRVWVPQTGTGKLQLDFIQREGENVEHNVQQFTHAYEVNDGQIAIDNAFAYLASGELRHQVPA